MWSPDQKEELQLVHKAISLIELEGCFEWDEGEGRRVLDQDDAGGLTLSGVRDAVHDAVCNEKRTCKQKTETREGCDGRFFYDIVVDCPRFKKGLYVEMVLVVAEEEFPELRIVNAHKAT